MSDVTLKRKPSERRALVDLLRRMATIDAEIREVFYQAADEIENLAARLEIDYVWQLENGELVQVEASDDCAHMDGIYCRDVTIAAMEADRDN